MTDKLGLRALEKEDLDFIHRLNNNPDIMSFWFEEPYQTKVELEDNYMKNKDNKHVRLFILEKSNEQLGLVALFSIDYIHRKAEFAIMIDPIHQGFGYSSKATKLAMAYAFNTLNLNKLYLIVDETNIKAIHVYEKVGFTKEAVLKNEFFVNGSYHNSVIMSMFQDEYLNKMITEQ
ncbi:GNAT family N-acetyltransferase [Virgibacillus sp. MSJ-26]|uniref:GNAT family N-acetyltransferase n=1 Tax=Virgibacillus sp. MSJ-26 TaxID=2841522 RepID=UPI001C106134|nr:GNAT family N-acetyltransferase [Virgibacillus sp. MSJ-26]MBU5467852.1 GNAT family N-acetyltransferase [Virgibacillus sp. MSJ-26]